MADNTELLTAVKVRLNITWQDNHTILRLRELIAEGQAYINSKLGEAADYQEPGYARTLLMEYVRYARDEALDVFESNYRSMLLAARDERAVIRYAEETTDAVPSEK